MTSGGSGLFPRRYRLTKTDEFSSVLGFRKAIRGKVIMLHYGAAVAQGQTARLGLVVGKKFLKSAVQRNLFKRIVREQFRLNRSALPARDLVVRLVVRLKKVDRQLLAEDFLGLLRKLRPVHPPEAEKTVC